jgi:hypothetical protein
MESVHVSQQSIHPERGGNTEASNCSYNHKRSCKNFDETLFYFKIFYVKLFIEQDLQFSLVILMKIIVLWDMTPCILVEHYEHFRGTCCFHLMSKRVTQA